MNRQTLFVLMVHTWINTYYSLELNPKVAGYPMGAATRAARAIEHASMIPEDLLPSCFEIGVEQLGKYFVGVSPQPDWLEKALTQAQLRYERGHLDAG